MVQRIEIPDPDFAVEPRRVAFGAESITVDILFRGRLIFTHVVKSDGDFPDYDWAKERALDEFAARLHRVLGEML